MFMICHLAHIIRSELLQDLSFSEANVPFEALLLPSTDARLWACVCVSTNGKITSNIVYRLASGCLQLFTEGLLILRQRRHCADIARVDDFWNANVILRFVRMSERRKRKTFLPTMVSTIDGASSYCLWVAVG
ncbi:6-phosphogluconate dehydrogenase-like protein [Anopheles sinensis]|uniref:6-phosphogluconate dehydrogenase-like protein n=1 Tax=Anopheles sinensis TaxID=74873 RepID=A0A084WBP3_ANOSI|nr:6-phosphogluconate dehydrogenase-like protein [Anopheles sinensis]